MDAHLFATYFHAQCRINKFRRGARGGYLMTASAKGSRKYPHIDGHARTNISLPGAKYQLKFQLWIWGAISASQPANWRVWRERYRCTSRLLLELQITQMRKYLRSPSIPFVTKDMSHLRHRRDFFFSFPPDKKIKTALWCRQESAPRLNQQSAGGERRANTGSEEREAVVLKELGTNSQQTNTQFW